MNLANFAYLFDYLYRKGSTLKIGCEYKSFYGLQNALANHNLDFHLKDGKLAKA